MKYDIRITTHAKERASERLNLSPKELAINAVLSLDEGIDALQDEVLRPLCLYRANKHESSGMYLYQGNIYVFNEDILVTVYPLSYLSEFKNVA